MSRIDGKLDAGANTTVLLGRGTVEVTAVGPQPIRARIVRIDITKTHPDDRTTIQAEDIGVGKELSIGTSDSDEIVELLNQSSDVTYFSVR